MDNIEMIKQFKELLDIGAITQEEFDAKKDELLGKMSSNPDSNTKHVDEDQQEKIITFDAENDLSIDNGENTVKNGASDAVSVEKKDNDKGKGFINSIPKPALIGIAVAILFIFILAAGGSGGNSEDNAIKGKWHCAKVAYLGEELNAYTEEQQNDYTLVIKSGSFQMNVYGEEINGTWKRATNDDYKLGSGGTLPSGQEVRNYIFSAGNPLLAIYYVDDDRIAVFMGTSPDEDNYIIYERD